MRLVRVMGEEQQRASRLTMSRLMISVMLGVMLGVFCGGVQDFSELGLTRATGGR